MRRWRENADSYREGSLNLKVLAEAKSTTTELDSQTPCEKARDAGPCL